MWSSVNIEAVIYFSHTSPRKRNSDWVNAYVNQFDKNFIIQRSFLLNLAGN